MTTSAFLNIKVVLLASKPWPQLKHDNPYGEAPKESKGSDAADFFVKLNVPPSSVKCATRALHSIEQIHVSCRLGSNGPVKDTVG